MDTQKLTGSIGLEGWQEASPPTKVILSLLPAMYRASVFPELHILVLKHRYVGFRGIEEESGT